MRRLQESARSEHAEGHAAAPGARRDRRQERQDQLQPHRGLQDLDQPDRDRDGQNQVGALAVNMLIIGVSVVLQNTCVILPTVNQREVPSLCFKIQVLRKRNKTVGQHK